MNHPHPRPTVLAAVLVLSAAVVPVACGPGGQAPEPREAVVAALHSTAELETVHALIQVQVEGGGQQIRASVEGDVDVAARELDVAAVISPEGLGAEQQFRLVVVDGSVFTAMGGQGWSVSGGPGQDPLEFVPTTARIAAAVETAIRDPETTVTMEGSEDCGDADCWKVRAEIPASVAWRAVTEMLSAGGAQATPEMPPTFPGFVIDVWVEHDTNRLRQATNTTEVENQTISIIVALARHDEPVEIVAPFVP